MISGGFLRLPNYFRYDTESRVGDVPRTQVAKHRSPGIPRIGASFSLSGQAVSLWESGRKVSA